MQGINDRVYSILGGIPLLLPLPKFLTLTPAKIRPFLPSGNKSPISSAKSDNETNRFFYHGHSIVHELLMFSEYNIGMKDKAIQTILKWFMSMYYQDESCFKYSGKPISKYSRKEDYMTARVAKYRLFHLIEDDWITYYLTRIMQNILKHEE